MRQILNEVLALHDEPGLLRSPVGVFHATATAAPVLQ
jgi:hypothetical protein